MKDSSTVGDKAVGAVLSALLKQHKTVLMPFGNSKRYDLAVDNNGSLERIQCKHGWLTKDKASIAFNTSSQNREKVRSDYVGQVDVFGVYCSEIDSVYLIPIEVLPKTIGRLRLEGTKNKQSANVKWAKDYEVGF